QSATTPAHLIVTNVPGPQQSLYCRGARLRALYPQVPLMKGLGMGIALMSYNGSMGWGFNSDPEVVPDADVFVQKIQESFERIRKLATPKTSKESQTWRAATTSSSNG
ncbi:MAG: hypothetical protein CL908_26545, partial [Deltaproteobacteria bacterium]|nr:hypothetical protein [Deltaproteobacteria bacterium]